jgi:hypothetical protein
MHRRSATHLRPPRRPSPSSVPRQLLLAGVGFVALILAASVATPSGQAGPPGPSGGGGSSPTPYPAAVQQRWLSDCEARTGAATCECDLSFFEQSVSYQQFEHDYSAVQPGAVPPELSGSNCGSGIGF